MEHKLSSTLSSIGADLVTSFKDVARKVAEVWKEAWMPLVGIALVGGTTLAYVFS